MNTKKYIENCPICGTKLDKVNAYDFLAKFGGYCMKNNINFYSALSKHLSAKGGRNRKGKPGMTSEQARANVMKRWNKYKKV